MTILSAWREGHLRDLDTRVVASMRSIATRVESRSIQIDAAAVGWGQYLDERFTGQQWGLLGTSAASQILALCDPSDDVYARHIKVTHARALLFEDRSAVSPHLRPQQDRGELGNIIRLASVAEALRLNRGEPIPRTEWPPVVEEIVQLRGTDPWWHSESASTHTPQSVTGSPFATAFVVCALQRYETDRMFDDSRLWLATHLGDPTIRRRLDLVALIGLALLGREARSTNTLIQDGIAACQSLIVERRGRSRRVIVDRPVFIGYAVDGRTDYAFLNPEILSALFMLRSGNPIAGRDFVLRAMSETTRHVSSGHAFETEFGGEATVEQLWTARAFYEYRRRAEDEELRKTLRPRLFLTLGTMMLAIVIVTLAAIGLALIYSDDEGGGVIALASGGTIAIIALYFSERGR